MEGLKIDELKEGTIYKCLLSYKPTLVIFQAGYLQSGEGEDETQEEVIKKLGKIAVVLDNGDVKYFVNELYDGQLIEQ